MNKPPDTDPDRELAGRIRARVGSVLDADEVAALIESFGITDGIAEQDYQARTVHALALRVEPLVSRSDVPMIAEEENPDDPVPYSYENMFTAALRKLQITRAYTWGKRYGRLHLQGFFFAMPMVVSILSLFIFKTSLWSALIKDLPVATAIGVGTLGSFVVTGGYSQAIGRRGLFYRFQEEHSLARAVCYYFIGVGFQTVLVTALLGFAFNFVSGMLTPRLAVIAVTYFVFLSLLWLFLAVLYMLGQPLLFTPIIIVGIVVVYVLRFHAPVLAVRQGAAMALAAALSFLGGYAAFSRRTSRRAAVVWGTLLAAASMLVTFRVLSGWHQDLVVGICVAALLSLFAILFEFSRREAREESDVKATELPRASLLWYKVGPYFIYGTLYYAFLFTDRLVAWSSPDASPVAGSFLFRTGYEVGAAWGLAVLLCTIGLAESAINTFSERIRDDEASFSIQDPQGLARVYRRFYAIRGAAFLVMSSIAGFALWTGVLAIARHSQSEFVRAYLGFIPRMVFLIATPGYALLSWSLFNNVFLFALSRPEKVITAMTAAIIVHGTLSYILTRLFGHQFAAVGFLAGCIVLSILTSISALRVIGDLDYYYYSAYL